jgi:hypothetical protein
MVEGEQKIQKHPEVDETLKRKAEVISIVMGGDYNMTASLGPWGSGWHWDFVKNHVNMDPKDLATESEEVGLGVASHEGNHRLVSRPEHVRDLWQEPGFSFGFNAVEDPRANEGGMYQKPGSRKWINAYIERDLSQGGGLDYKGMQKDVEKKLGYVPDHMKWGAEMIRYWYEKEFQGKLTTSEDKDRFLEEIPDKDVRDLVKDTVKDFEDFYHAIPHSKDEMEVQREAKKSSSIFKDKIWDKYKELVKKSYKDQDLANMINDMLKGQKGENQGNGQTMAIPFESLPKDIQDEIKQKIKEQQEKNKQQQGQEGKRNQQQSSQSGDSGNKENQNGASSQEGGNQQKQGQSGSQKNESSQQEKNGQDQNEEKVPWDKLSDKAKRETEKIFDQLPKDQKDNYEEKTKKDMESAEDNVNEKLRGKMNNPTTVETNKERREREAKEQQKDQQQQEAQRQIREMEKRTERALKALERNPYHEYINAPDVAAIRRRTDREFKLIFQPTEEPDIRYSSSGLRPNMKRAIQMEADPRRTNIFEIKGRPREKNYRFLMLIDLSPSMTGKIEEVFKVVVAYAEAMNKYGLEYSLVGFSDGFQDCIRVYKDFGEKKLTKEIRDRIGEMIGDCDSGSGTPTKEATGASFKILQDRLRRYNMPNNYFITITDGQPTSSSAQSILNQQTQIRKNKDILSWGAGIGSGSEFVNQCYPQLNDRIRADIATKLGKNIGEVSNWFDNALDFSQAFDIIMMYMVKHPELFHK